MGRVGEEESDLLKSQLVTDICSISSHSISSNTRHCRLHRYISTAPFIDWYLLLQVEENAHIDVIRRQFRKLALQLHPDKNKHPKAEVAFKLVSEAYACLSDKTKRKAFDSARCNSFCNECTQISSYKSCSFPAKRQTSSDAILRQLRVVRDIFREEVRTIEKCLKVNNASSKEYPVFDPSDHLFQDYPHNRTKVYRKSEDMRYLQAENLQSFHNRRGKCESPIFQIRSESILGSRKPVFLSS
ncbi:Dnaj heat shock n-terminal domain-containing protein [Thalictrum thalictroides]|uniref:Dnaj heat shock n-terminal domain-containing protein n=1 Tax=Thalictrum thalictroides TaxID=46969 RepID=A0A7J6V8R7_THATH|nr:Dnaj heat shock n-terminal domain-containing protein [Thalictrum thalictroides]